jgi:hypothetical protein
MRAEKSDTLRSSLAMPSMSQATYHHDEPYHDIKLQHDGYMLMTACHKFCLRVVISVAVISVVNHGMFKASTQ